MYEIDESQIRLWWQIFKAPNRLAEVRLLGGKSSLSGYFKSVDSLISNMRYYLEKEDDGRYTPLQAYCIFNDIDEALYGREQHERFVNGAKTTRDEHITRRNFVLLDLDSKRISGVSADASQFEKAHLKAVEIYRYLMDNGFSEPIICISGNGYHLYLPCDMPNDDAHHLLVNKFIKSLGNIFTDEYVDVDQSVGNAANLTKMMGSWAKKGACTEERPWRLARFVKIPQELKVNDDSLFQKIADLLPQEEPKKAPNRQYQSYNNAPFDLRAWLNDHSIEYREETQGDSTKFVLRHCPWEETHSSIKEWESAVFLSPDGQITFSCFHAHCKDKTWFDFRQFYEPDAYNKPSYQPQQVVYVQSVKPQKPKYEIKDELPELGEKWLSMSSIKKVNLLELEHVRTGFSELDKNIVGLFMSEVTILSGNNGSGKSTWLNTLLLNIINQGIKVALWSGELRADILKAWIQMAAAGKRNLRESQYDNKRFYVPNHIADRIDEWMDGKFFLYNNEYGDKWEQIFHDMELLLRAGVKVFALDNLFSLDIDILNGDKNNKQKDLILQIKEFAKKNMVHIILVAHPRKTTSFLRKNDIAGTSDLQNAVDKIFCVHRVNNDFFRTGAEFFGQAEIQRFHGVDNTVEIMKERLFGVVDLMVGMHYEIESRRFKNTPNEDIRYGWEAEPVQQEIDYSYEPQTPIDYNEGLPLGEETNQCPF